MTRFRVEVFRPGPGRGCTRVRPDTGWSLRCFHCASARAGPRYGVKRAMACDCGRSCPWCHPWRSGREHRGGDDAEADGTSGAVGACSGGGDTSGGGAGSSRALAFPVASDEGFHNPAFCFCTVVQVERSRICFTFWNLTNLFDPGFAILPVPDIMKCGTGLLQGAASTGGSTSSSDLNSGGKYFDPEIWVSPSCGPFPGVNDLA